MIKKSKSTKQIRAIDRIIKFQIDDGIESLTISGKEVLADVAIDRQSNVTLFLNADPDKINDIQSLVPFVTVKTTTGGTETDKTKTVTLSQDLTQFALEIADNSKELARLIKTQSSIKLDLGGLVQQLLEIAGKLAEMEQKNVEQDERLTAIEVKDLEQDERLDNIETKNQEQDNRLTELKNKGQLYNVSTGYCEKSFSGNADFTLNIDDQTTNIFGYVLMNYNNTTFTIPLLKSIYTHREGEFTFDVNYYDSSYTILVSANNISGTASFSSVLFRETPFPSNTNRTFVISVTSVLPD